MDITSKQIQEIQDLLHDAEESQMNSLLDDCSAAMLQFIAGKAEAYRKVIKILGI